MLMTFLHDLLEWFESNNIFKHITSEIPLRHLRRTTSHSATYGGPVSRPSRFKRTDISFRHLWRTGITLRHLRRTIFTPSIFPAINGGQPVSRLGGSSRLFVILTESLHTTYGSTTTKYILSKFAGVQ
ncbi:hypothetical protein HanRHA438_Chr13g0591431 [Helianthus annuus]|nr:hypothetical protein HanIR_Chr13g0632131 [Helianthus annuus]KAJ0857544.1 hypothetical protein HanRHA438_Chr13g0591431 [Helianthus annuus]